MDKMKIQKLSSLCIIVVFMGFIFGLCILSTYGVMENNAAYSYYENRSLASFPEIEKETILDGSFFTQIDDWYRAEASRGK